VFPEESIRWEFLVVWIFDQPGFGPINYDGCYGAKWGCAREDSRMFLPRWPGFGARLCIANTRKAHALDYLDRDVIVTY
jgi:hypothetical protein